MNSKVRRIWMVKVKPPPMDIFQKLSSERECLALVFHWLGKWRGVAARVCWEWRNLLLRKEERELWSSVITSTPELLHWALKEGALEVTRLFDYKKWELSFRIVMIAEMIRKGNLEMVKKLWPLREDGEKKNFSISFFCEEAAAAGSLEVLAWLRGFDSLKGEKTGEHLAAWGDSVSYTARKHGRTKLLRWCLKRGCSYNPKVCASLAAQEGSLSLATYFINLSEHWDSGIYWAAARGGSLELLDWLFEANAPALGSKEFIYLFDEKVSLPVFKWLENHFQIISKKGGQKFYQKALEKNRKEVFLWILTELKLDARGVDLFPALEKGWLVPARDEI